MSRVERFVERRPRIQVVQVRTFRRGIAPGDRARIRPVTCFLEIIQAAKGQ